MRKRSFPKLYIAPNGNGFTDRATEVIKPLADLFGLAELDEMGDWFTEDTPLDDLGRACINGGVEGAIRQMERNHGFRITR